MHNPETGFDRKTERLFGLLGAQSFPTFSAINFKNIAEYYPHLILDVDGVLQPYGGEPSEEVIHKLHETHQMFDAGISLMTNGNNSPILPGIPTHNRGWLRIKQRPGIIKTHLQTIHEKLSPDQTFAIGDGLSDIMAYRIARLGGIGIVKASPDLPGHPIQTRVRENIYGPVLTKAHVLLDAIEATPKAVELFATP